MAARPHPAHGTTPAVTFPDDAAFEVQYSPYGVDSGLCTGVAATAVAGEKVTLEPCGVSSKTVWIVDPRTARSATVTFPLINGSDTNFSQPFVLTYPGSGYPRQAAAGAVRQQPDRFPGCERVPDRHHQRQPLFGADFGVLK